MKKLCLAVIWILVGGCAGGDNVPEPVTPEVSGSSLCASAERNLLALGCEEGKPTKKGKSFTQFCEETQANGIDLHPGCLSKITRCEQMDKECAWGQ